MKHGYKTRRVALLGLFGAAALAVSYLESALTAFLPLPPGVKPGLANVVITFICLSLGFLPALGITLIKSAFVFLVSGFSGGVISLAGGVVSVAVTAGMLSVKKRYPERLSFTGVSVVSAVGNNAGQLAAASLLVGSALYLAYAPALLLSAVVFGTLTGIIMNAVMPALQNLRLFSEKRGKGR